MEELWAKWFFVALAQNFKRLDGQEIFAWVFLKEILSFKDMDNTQIVCEGESQGVVDLALSGEVGGTNVAPSFL